MKNLEKTSGALRVVELFAGVGGFRHGLESARDGQGHRLFDTVWASQWEPRSPRQHAAQVYRARWGERELVNRNILEVLQDSAEMARLVALAPDVLVGGFPCQDYSVAQPSSRARGIDGRRGVLWWAIPEVLGVLADAGTPVKYLLLENVDRLLSSSKAAPGRDFSIMLACLQELGYGIEWRVVNAADYGYPQRRKRVFILAYHASTSAYRALRHHADSLEAATWLTQTGVMAQALQAVIKGDARVDCARLPSDVVEVQARAYEGKSWFKSGGLCIEGRVLTAPVIAANIADFTPFVGQGAALTLGDVVRGTVGEIPPDFFIDEARLPAWAYLKGAKQISRTGPNGHSYRYTEGGVPFPDSLEASSRTVITSEGGSGASRTTHVVRHADGRLRRLTSEELEALNGFPRGFTAIPGLTDSRRGFLMGNALVTGLVHQLGTALALCQGKAEYGQTAAKLALIR